MRALSKTQRLLLQRLADWQESGEILNYQEAAEQLGYKAPSAIHRLVGVLAERGLVERGQHLHQIRVSTAGWQTLGRQQPLPGIPILGSIAAGSPILAEENLAGWLPELQPRAGCFALQVQGESMIGAQIFDGDYALIDSGSRVRSGHIAAVQVDDDATLKYVHYEADGIRLVAANPTIPDRRLNDAVEWRLLGELYLVVRSFSN
jgi:repressor LexA